MVGPASSAAPTLLSASHHPSGMIKEPMNGAGSAVGDFLDLTIEEHQILLVSFERSCVGGGGGGNNDDDDGDDDGVMGGG